MKRFVQLREELIQEDLVPLDIYVPLRDTRVTIEVLENPSKTKLLGFLKRSKMKTIRGILDEKTLDHMWWDASMPVIHRHVIEQLKLPDNTPNLVAYYHASDGDTTLDHYYESSVGMNMKEAFRIPSQNFQVLSKLGFDEINGTKI